MPPRRFISAAAIYCRHFLIISSLFAISFRCHAASFHFDPAIAAISDTPSLADISPFSSAISPPLPPLLPLPLYFADAAIIIDAIYFLRFYFSPDAPW
jgi:hypothetical protein